MLPFPPPPYQYSAFCSTGHYLKGNQIGRQFLGGESQRQFKLNMLERAHPQFGSLEKQFTNKWKKPGSVPTMERVFEIKVCAAKTVVVASDVRACNGRYLFRHSNLYVFGSSFIHCALKVSKCFRPVSLCVQVLPFSHEIELYV